MLVKLERTDFLFFSSSSFMKRFAHRPEFQAHFPDIELLTLSETHINDTHRLIVRYYQDRVPQGNSTKLYPFTIKKGSNIYGLVFGSKHPLGLAKYLDLSWKQNPTNGEANFDIDEDVGKAQGELFEEYRQLTKIQRFEARLEEFIRDKQIATNRDICEFAFEQGHPISHAAQCVSKLKQQKKVQYSGYAGISYEACFKKNRIVEIKAVK